MKKAASKPTGPLSLGSKRLCKKCQTKFYDFNKEEFECPKCKHVMNQDDFLNSTPARGESKKKSSEKITTEGLMQGDEAESTPADPFDSDDDLSEDAEDVVEDIEVDDEDESDY